MFDSSLECHSLSFHSHGHITYTDGQKKRYNCSNNSKNIQSRVMVLVHDTSSYFALQLYEVSFK